MDIKDKVIIRKIAGDTLLIPIGKYSQKYNGVFTLTPSAAKMFELLAEGKEKDEIVEAVYAEFEADKEQIAADYDTFVESLKEFDIL